MIEDLSRSRDVEIFRFLHKQDQADCLQIAAEDVAGDQDIELSLTTGWLRDSMTSPYGVIPILFSERMDFSFLDIFSDDFEQMESKLQSGEIVGYAAETAAEAEKLSNDIDIIPPQELTEDQAKNVFKVVQKCSRHYLWAEQ